MPLPKYKECRPHLANAIESVLKRHDGRLDVSKGGMGELFEFYRSLEAAPELSDHWLSKRFPVARSELVKRGVILGAPNARRNVWEFSKIRREEGEVVVPPRIPILPIRAIYVFEVQRDTSMCRLGATQNCADRFSKLNSQTKCGKYPSGSRIAYFFAIRSHHTCRHIERLVHSKLKAVGRYDATERYGSECFFGNPETIAAVARWVMTEAEIVFSEYDRWPLNIAKRVTINCKDTIDTTKSPRKLAKLHPNHLFLKEW